MPEHQKILNEWLDQYGTECFGRLIIATIRKNMEMKGLMSKALGVKYQQHAESKIKL